MSIKAKLLTAVSITLMSVASFCAIAQNVPNVALPNGWSATQDDNGKVTLQYSGDKRVKSVKVSSCNLFSVSKYKKVVFSSGNLQYQPSTGTWRFAENQWNYVGDAKNGNVYENGVKCNNALIAEDYTGWIDLFGWGTGKNPTEIEGNANNYSIFNDWGNEIDKDIGWYTLTIDEWNYIIKERENANMKSGTSCVNGVNGLVILPDQWILPTDMIFNPGYHSYSNNKYTLLQWKKMETAGAVFLPAGGYRKVRVLSDVNDYGGYKSSTERAYDAVSDIYFRGSGVYVFYNGGPRAVGQSVRLVRLIDLVPTVDLGISDGTQWATCNLVSDNPWNYGDYYSWGEIETKESYSAANYKYANGSLDKLKKYCYDSSLGEDGYTDELTELQSEDDPATSILGVNYCTPTQEDWNNLYKECYWVETNSYAGKGVGGFIVYKSYDKTKDYRNIKGSNHVYSPENDTHIFIPLAGYYTSILKDAGSRIDYWSSTVSSGTPKNAIFMFSFSSVSALNPNCTGARSTGRSIRPVRHKKQE
ncbi:MAG: hypothetical protein J6Y82_04540 [Bacteroidales bacterium]|nr:hypothetical protein [Bacteroidales bacterium]